MKLTRALASFLAVLCSVHAPQVHSDSRLSPEYECAQASDQYLKLREAGRDGMPNRWWNRRRCIDQGLRINRLCMLPGEKLELHFGLCLEIAADCGYGEKDMDAAAGVCCQLGVCE